MLHSTSKFLDAYRKPDQWRNSTRLLYHDNAPAHADLLTRRLLSNNITFPTLTFTIYKECVRTGCFPKKWKISKMIPIPKLGRENINDASKYRPISLINVGGKVLEKILINRIMHHLNKNNLMNKNQFGFTPGKGTTDAILAVKDFIEEGIKQRHITILITLEVKSAIDAAWWPSIIHALKEFNCPKDLYNLAKSYFSERKVTLYSNSKKIEREASKGCPQGSCSGPGFWNIQYNSLLNLDFGKRTKAIAFADDLLIAVKAETAKEAENFANTVKCRCTERQYNEMFRIAKLFLGPFPFPYLLCVKTFHFNEFRTFSITN